MEIDTYRDEGQGEVKDGGHGEDKDIVVQLRGLSGLADRGRVEQLSDMKTNNQQTAISKVMVTSGTYAVPKTLGFLHLLRNTDQKRLPELPLLQYDALPISLEYSGGCLSCIGFLGEERGKLVFRSGSEVQPFHIVNRLVEVTHAFLYPIRRDAEDLDDGKVEL